MKTTNREISILKSIQNVGIPVGASYLSRQLNIAPATIGRILTDLENQGFLSKVSNKGRVLTQSGTDFLQQEDLREQKAETAERLAVFVTEADKQTLLEVLQVRKLLEGYTARQACQNATEEELLEMERLMLEHLQEIRSGGVGSKTDFRIHLAIAKASKIETIYQILKLILSSDNAYAKFSYVSGHVKNTQIKQHDSIIQAIQERNPEKAEKAMETHLDQIMKDVEQYYQEPD